MQTQFFPFGPSVPAQQSGAADWEVRSATSDFLKSKQQYYKPTSFLLGDPEFVVKAQRKAALRGVLLFFSHFQLVSEGHSAAKTLHGVCSFD